MYVYIYVFLEKNGDIISFLITIKILRTICHLRTTYETYIYGTLILISVVWILQFLIQSKYNSCSKENKPNVSSVFITSLYFDHNSVSFFAVFKLPFQFSEYQ